MVNFTNWVSNMKTYTVWDLLNFYICDFMCFTKLGEFSVIASFNIFCSFISFLLLFGTTSHMLDWYCHTNPLGFLEICSPPYISFSNFQVLSIFYRLSCTFHCPQVVVYTIFPPRVCSCNQKKGRIVVDLCYHSRIKPPLSSFMV